MDAKKKMGITKKTKKKDDGCWRPARTYESVSRPRRSARLMQQSPENGTSRCVNGSNVLKEPEIMSVGSKTSAIIQLLKPLEYARGLSRDSPADAPQKESKD